MKCIPTLLFTTGLVLSFSINSATADNNQSKVVKNAGLRSDGELVQGDVSTNRLKRTDKGSNNSPAPVVPAPTKSPKKEIRNNDLRDEMPDDLPAG